MSLAEWRNPHVMSEFVELSNYLSVDGVGATFYNDDSSAVSVLEEITFRMTPGEFVSFVGPSGCGKTTLLKIIAGLIRPTIGRVSLKGRIVEGPPKGVVYLSQQYSKALFPWRTALKNVEFALESQNVTQRDRRNAALDALGEVGLAAYASYYPCQLSGGMQQRVAIARALAARPQLLLMDEPFSALDALTRMDLQDLTLRIWSQNRLSILLVTHDVEEAAYLSDRIFVLTGRPATIVKELSIDLPRPRHQLTTRESPQFVDVRRRLYEIVRRRAEPLSYPNA